MESGLRRLGGPQAWHGRELAASGRWRFRLTADELDEVDTALAAVRARGTPWPQLHRRDFPLPGLVPKLAAIAEQLEHGSGVANLAGLPIDRYDVALEVCFETTMDPGDMQFLNNHAVLWRNVGAGAHRGGIAPARATER